MQASSRDRISIDLRGMKAALLIRSQADGVTPSDFIRSAINRALELSPPALSAEPLTTDRNNRVRLSLRMQREDAQALHQRAQAAGLPLGDFVAGLIAGAPVLLSGQRPIDHVAALTASCAELSTLGRDLRHLTTLLRQGSVRAAQEHRERLEGAADQIKAHLAEACALMAALRPLRRTQRKPESERSDP